MDIIDLRTALRRQPFQPFNVCLADGRILPVPHPECVALTSRHAIVVGKDDSWSLVEPLLVVSLDFQPLREAS